MLPVAGAWGPGASLTDTKEETADEGLFSPTLHPEFAGAATVVENTTPKGFYPTKDGVLFCHIPPRP